VLTARGRNKGLQAGLAPSEMVESIWACTLCGYCDAICPSEVHNVDIVLDLRQAMADHVPISRPPPAWSALVLGCTIRERAAHLIPSIQRFLDRIGRPSDVSSDACCGSLEVEAGRAPRLKSKAGVVADPVCLEQYDADFLGALAMQHLDLFDLEPPFYYYAPHRLVNRDHARLYPLYDRLRHRFNCDMNFDLNRLARSTTAGSVQALAGHDARDIPAAVARLLSHSRAERIVTCSPADYLAFKAYSGRDTRYITECLI
jgi:ferredoxin